LGAFAGDDGGFAAIAAFDEGFAGGDGVAALGAVAAMALETGGFDDFLDMLVESDPGFGGGRRQFRDVGRFVGGVNGEDNGQQSAQGERGGEFWDSHHWRAFEQNAMVGQPESAQKRLASVGLNLLK
jgi:hypothetical protein